MNHPPLHSPGIATLPRAMAFTLIELPVRRGGRKRAFTLIELLVVVTVIIVLIAILMPAMERAIETAQKAKCLVNQRTIVVSARMYADQNKQIYPSYKDPAGGAGQIDPWDLRTTNIAPRVPIGLGLLPHHNYLPSTQLGKVVHCPLLNTMAIPEGNPGHNMDVIHASGVGGSYWIQPQYNDRRVIMGYQYRAPTYFEKGEKDANGNRSKAGDIRAAFAGSTFIITVDTIDYRVGIKYHHRTGYNRAFADGSGAWFSDPDRFVDNQIYNRRQVPEDAREIDEDMYDYLSVSR